MARISIRFFDGDTELDRIDADLPAEAYEIVAECKRWLAEWQAASEPDSEEDSVSMVEALRQWEDRRQSLDERRRLEEAYAERVLRARDEVALPKPVQSDRATHAQRVLKERDEG